MATPSENVPHSHAIHRLRPEGSRIGTITKSTERDNQHIDRENNIENDATHGGEVHLHETTQLAIGHAEYQSDGGHP